MQYSAVVLCAGSGSRANLGYNKVLFHDGKKYLFEYALETFLEDERCTEVVVVTQRAEREQFETIIKQKPFFEKVKYTDGGKERSDSVYHAIKGVAHDKVMIHDSARGKIDISHIDQLLEALSTYDAALLGLPVVDTVKKVRNGEVVETVNREELYLAQTPQAFNTLTLRALIEKARQDEYAITDEIMLFEHYQVKPKIKMIKGSKQYKKFTLPEDFII